MSDEGFDAYFDEVENETRPSEPYGRIQWKGTDVCIDMYCICGAHGHFDGDFLYTTRCRKCGRIYGLAPWIVLVPLSDEALKWAEPKDMEHRE